MKKYFLTTLLLIGFASCTRNTDNTYFNGGIYQINSRVKKMENVKLSTIPPLDGVNFGIIAVYDSLMIFWNPKLPDRFFNVFNLDTGKEIGTFCNRGQGPGEFISINPIYQFFEENNDLKTLLFAPNENEMLKWNISQSVERGETVIDTIVSYACSKNNMMACYNYIFRQSEDILFVYIPSFELNEEEASLPFYQKRTLYSNTTLESYQVFKKSIKNGEASIIPEAFFNSVTAFKPDGSRIVQFMKRLTQFNIINTVTGEVIGYRLEGSPDFSILEKKKKSINVNYVRAQADDEFIYASYWGKEDWGHKEIPLLNNIHVFDWSGKLLYELKTDQPVHEMWLDRVRNRLYTTNLNVDDVFYIDLDEIK